jgi:putative DNA primase/helicase
VNMIDHALAYDAKGWVVVPMVVAKKKALVKWKEVTEPDAIRTERYWRSRPDASIGVLCGPSNLVVIDEDDPTGLKFIPDLPPTATVTTGRGRHHIYTDRTNGRLRNTTGRVPVRGKWIEAPGIDIRATGGLFIAPPSLHKSGVRYKWDDDALDVGIAPAPGWLQPVAKRKPIAIEATTGDYKHQIEAILDVIRRASNGQRNSCTNWAGYRLGELVIAGKISHSDAFGKLYDAAVGVGLDDDEAETTVNSGLDAWSTA